MSSLPRRDEPKTHSAGPLLRCDGIELNVAAHTVNVHGDPISLSPQEFRLLATFLENLDHVLTSKYLLDELWGPNFVGDPGTLNVHVLRIRTKLGRYPGASAHIRTVRGVGYVFDSIQQPADS